MEERITNPLDDTDLSPAAYAALLLERTDENGYLSIPEGHFTDGLTDYDASAQRTFEMNWNSEKLEDLIGSFETLRRDIREIAGICSSAGCDPLHDAQIPALGTGGSFAVWKTYIRRYDLRGLHPEVILAIEKCMREELGEEEPTAEERQLCARYYDAYIQAEKEEAAERLGGGIFDTEVIWRARRVCVLVGLHAPDLILRNEEQRLIEALALTRFAKREIGR